MDRAGIELQMQVFGRARIIIGMCPIFVAVFAECMHSGAHGAGLSNMIYAPSDAAVVEFGLSPQIDRCFGHMAVALGLQYWLVPQVTTNLFNAYLMDEGRAGHVVSLVRHIIERNKWEGIIRRDEL